MFLQTAALEDVPSSDSQHKFTITLMNEDYHCDLPAGAGSCVWQTSSDSDERFRYVLKITPIWLQYSTQWSTLLTDATCLLYRNSMSAATSKILNQEFESIQQLHEMEPDNKC